MVLIRMFPRAGSQVGVGSGPTAVGILDRPQGGVPGIHLPDTPIYPIPVSHPPLLLMGTAPSSRSKVVPDFAVKSWGPPRWQARPCYPLSPPIHHHGGEPRVGLSRNREPTRLPTASRMAQAHTTPDLRRPHLPQACPGCTGGLGCPGTMTHPVTPETANSQPPGARQA